MKLIGLIGGMSWESTAQYYEIINTVIKEKLGGFHSAKVIMYSVDFHEIEECQTKGEWDKAAVILSEAAVKLEKAGADFIVICTNTMHKVADEIQRHIGIPILHIAEAAIWELKNRGIEKVGLLGTKYTMRQDFYRSKFTESGIEVIIPDDMDVEKVNSVIYGELCMGVVSDVSREAYLKIIDGLAARGAQGVILGCTEIGMLVKQDDTRVPLFDTACIHAQKAALLSMEE